MLLNRLIGSGAAGMTYAVTWHGATVAVKIATPCASGRDSWRAEVRALTKLHHPNVVRCMGTVVAPPTYCLVLWVASVSQAIVFTHTVHLSTVPSSGVGPLRQGVPPPSPSVSAMDYHH